MCLISTLTCGFFAPVAERQCSADIEVICEPCVHRKFAALDERRKLPKQSPYVFPGATPDKPMGEFRRPWRKAAAEVKIMRRGRQVHIPVKSLRKARAAWKAERGVAESALQGLAYDQQVLSSGDGRSQTDGGDPTAGCKDLN